jgi:hypothetical protein
MTMMMHMLKRQTKNYPTMHGRKESIQHGVAKPHCAAITHRPKFQHHFSSLLLLLLLPTIE